MSNWKSRAAVGLGAMGLAAGVLTAISPDQPQTEQDRSRSNIERDLGNLSDSEEANRDRFRDEGKDLGDANNEERLRPGEHRPPKLRIRFP